jgi:hypothetical protein
MSSAKLPADFGNGQRSLQKLGPGADVVHLLVAILFQQKFGHPAAGSAGTAQDHGRRLGHFVQSVSQFR